MSSDSNMKEQKEAITGLPISEESSDSSYPQRTPEEIKQYFIQSYREHLTFRRHNKVKLIALVCAIAQLAVFLFLVIAAPLDIYKGRAPRTLTHVDANTGAVTKWEETYCLSLWGKTLCGSHKRIAGLPDKGFACHIVEQFITAAAASTIIAIVFSFFTFLSLIVFLILNYNIRNDYYQQYKAYRRRNNNNKDGDGESPLLGEDTAMKPKEKEAAVGNVLVNDEEEEEDTFGQELTTDAVVLDDKDDSQEKNHNNSLTNVMDSKRHHPSLPAPPCMSGTTLPALLSLMAMGFTLYAMAFVLGARNKGCGDRNPSHIIATDYEYGPSAGLIITSFVLEFLIMAFLSVSMCM